MINSEKKNKKIVSHLTKTEIYLVRAEYCLNNCSKCPPFAGTHARRRQRHSSLSVMAWSMPCQTCRKRCFSSQHLFRKKYLLFTKNSNRKLKQQITKCIKIGCEFENQCMLHFRLYFLPNIPKFEL